MLASRKSAQYGRHRGTSPGDLLTNVSPQRRAPNRCRTPRSFRKDQREGPPLHRKMTNALVVSLGSAGYAWVSSVAIMADSSPNFRATSIIASSRMSSRVVMSHSRKKE